MERSRSIWPLVAIALGCAEGLPSDVAGYAERCVRLNAAPIPSEGDDDPHEGVKNVYACNVTPDQLRDASGQPLYPFPEGTLIVKESQREDQDYVWLIALMRKEGGSWKWTEYHRNFPDQDFGKLALKETVCTGCHAKVESLDWVYTPYAAP